MLPLPEKAPVFTFLLVNLFKINTRMTKLAQALFFTLALMTLTTQCSSDPALSLTIPNEGFELVQQLPSQNEARMQNALYQPARAITKREMASTALRTLVDSMYAVMLQNEGVGIAANQLGKRLQIFIIEAKAHNAR